MKEILTVIAYILVVFVPFAALMLLDEYIKKRKRNSNSSEKEQSLMMERVEKYDRKRNEAFQAYTKEISAERLRQQEEFKENEKQEKERLNRELEQTQKLELAKIEKEMQKIYDLGEKHRAELANLEAKIKDKTILQAALNDENFQKFHKENYKNFINISCDKKILYKELLEVAKLNNDELFKTAIYKIGYDFCYKDAVKFLVDTTTLGNKISGIYRITSPDGRIYIGQAVDIKARWVAHAKRATGIQARTQAMLYKAIDEKGLENFTFDIVEEAPRDLLSERERFYINYYNSKNLGLNMKI